MHKVLDDRQRISAALTQAKTVVVVEFSCDQPTRLLQWLRPVSEDSYPDFTTERVQDHY